MYIKQVVIQGFKSYHDQTVVEPFDAGHNVIVGRNGSGKSNFFTAIQFVLSDEFNHLKPEQRQSLLHDGPGPRVISAHVEIIFDNTDGRIPIAKDEVHLRRVIGEKKDNYFLNKMTISRSDVLNLLETAGFSKSNPYYIVKQGEITKMATATDAQRLKLLQEVAGTCVYDKNSEESKSVIQVAKVSVENVQDRLNSITERLRGLEVEKEELKEYQRWDKQKRCLEYTIYNRELKELGEKLHDLMRHQDKCNAEQTELRLLKEKNLDEYNVAVKRLSDAKKEAKTFKENLDAIRAEQQELVREKTRLILTIKDLTAEVDGEEDMVKRYQLELEELEPTIAEKEEELANVKSMYDELMAEESECTLNLAIANQKRKELLAKHGRGRQFSSKEMRDEWIKNELEKLTKQIEAKEKHLEEIKEGLKKDSEKRKKLQETVAERTSEMEKQRQLVDNRNLEYEKLYKEKEKCQALRKEKCREEHALQCELSGRNDELAKVEQTLRSLIGKRILDGDKSIHKVLATFRARGDMSEELEGYYGQVIDMFDCDKSAYTAVGVTAGNRLFHHVVQTDKLSRKIFKEMNHQALPGEITFMPLNRLSSRLPNYPDTVDSKPMMYLLNYDPKYQAVLSYIFGKTLVCRSMDVATYHAKEYGFDCVTMDGDQVSSKGSLTGGHLTVQFSRIEIHKNRTELVDQISDLQNRLTSVKNAIRKADEDTNSYLSQMQRMETLNNQATVSYEKMKGEIHIMKEELKSIESNRTFMERSCAECAANLETMRVTERELQQECDQDLKSQLSDAEHDEIDALNAQIRDLTAKSKNAFAKRRECEVEKNKLENLLTNSLKRRGEELAQAIRKISVEDREHQLNLCKTKLANIENKLTSVENDLEALNKKVAAALQKKKLSLAEVEKLKVTEKDLQGKIEANMKDLVLFANKQNLLQEKLNECRNKIGELGALSNPETYAKFEAMSMKQLFREIEKTNNQLKNYSHINKKALEQFVSFSDQREKLVSRKEELDRAEDKIAELMHVLDERKNEAIHFTFKQVSTYFAEIFEKLVPSGFGKLVMKTADGDVDENVEELDTWDCQRFTGISIRVSFTGQMVEIREMNQLSGGQKSLVAIAMIFAIQKCDPAPFYLFDEIDQALDAEHRRAVADMIHELSSSAQFITTTFKPELLQHANKFYGVTYHGKVSHVSSITQEEAADFVSDENPQQ